MKLDHVTYQVQRGYLTDSSLDIFFRILEMQEVKPDDAVEKDWRVRWWQDKDGFQIHLVESPHNDPKVDLKLGHFCAILSRSGYVAATDSTFCERNSKESPRAWLRHAGTGLRVEIRPKPLILEDNPHLEPELIRQLEEASPSVLDWKEVSTSSHSTEAMMVNVFNESLRIFKSRNQEHRDSWRQEGWRGCVSNVRRKAVRAWDNLWHADKDKAANVDDLYDVINYCAFTIISAWEQNRDGDWNY